MIRNVCMVLLLCLPLLSYSQKAGPVKTGIKLLVMADSLNPDGTMAQLRTGASTVESYYNNVDSVKVDIYRNDTLVGHLYSNKFQYTNPLKLRAGSYSVKATKPGYVSQTSNDVQIEDGKVLYHVIVMDHSPGSK